MIPFPGQSNKMIECASVFSRRRLPFRSPDYKRMPEKSTMSCDGVLRALTITQRMIRLNLATIK
jgi:hypothetical protein